MILFDTADGIELTPLDAEDQGRGLFRVDKPIKVMAKLPGMVPVEVTIPAGFITDGSSIPWWARWILDPWGPNGLPGILHDYLLIAVTNAAEKWVVDRVFYDALRSQGVPFWRAALMWLAVRTQG